MFARHRQASPRFCRLARRRFGLGACVPRFALAAAILSAAVGVGVAGPGPEAIQAETLRADVERLASDSFRGRGTGEEGSRLAETYVADRFRVLGLVPIPGRDDFFLDFVLYTSRPDAARTTLTWSLDESRHPVGPGAFGDAAAGPFDEARRPRDGVAGAVQPEGADRALVGQDFRPFPFSDSGEARGELVFAGYGISAPDIGAGYDDYEGIDVRGRFVLVLRHEPGEEDPASPFEGRENSAHALFTTKAAAAQARGALGMLLVTDPLHHERADDLRLQSRVFLDLEDAERTLEAQRGVEAQRGAEAQRGVEAQRGAEAQRGVESQQGVEARQASPPGSEGTDPPVGPPPFLAIHISEAVAEFLLSSSGRTLASLQERIDRSLEPESFAIPGVEVSLSIQFDPDLERIDARNVAGLLPGRDPELRDEWVVVGAHHDHLGAFRGPGDTVFNGADDNASGVAGVLELAEAFARRPDPPRRSVLFTTFAAEEIGLLGSRAMVEQEQIPMNQIVFLLNMDMLGRNPERPVELIGDGYAPGLAAVIDAAFVEQTLEEQSEEQAETRKRRRPSPPLEIRLGGMDFMGNTDHTPFFARGVPFLTLFTGLHEDYHQLSDHAELLDFPRMESIVRLAGRIVERIAELPDALPFLHDISWLGLHLESFRSSADAAAVSWIEDDSQAQRLGIRVGDRLTAVDGVGAAPTERVGERLSEIAPGTSTKISLRRGEEIFAVTATRAHPGYLGILPGSVDDDTRRELALRSNEGVLVRNIVPGGPSEKAGLRGGDILIEIAGHTIDDGSLRGRLAQIGAGERIEVVLVRDGERRTITMTLAERPQGG